MYRDHSIGVVVPAYNEAGFVGEVVRTVPAFVDRIYVVDDGSTDGTWEEILAAADEADASSPDVDRTSADEDQASWATEDRTASATRGDHASTRDDAPRVVPIRHHENRGVGGAIKTGYRRVVADDVDVAVVMGGDGQMEPEILPRLLDPIVDGDADYVKGNRLMGRTGPGSMPRFRYTGNILLSQLTRIASGYWKNGDPQSGYTAISREALERIDLDGLYEDYGYCNDILVRLNVERQRVCDVPRPITYGNERSGIVYSRYIPRVSALLLRGFLRRVGRSYADERDPVALYYAGGVLAFLGAFLRVVTELTRRTSPVGAVRRALPLFSTGVALLVVGVDRDRRRNADVSFSVGRSEAADGRDGRASRDEGARREGPAEREEKRGTDGRNGNAEGDGDAVSTDGDRVEFHLSQFRGSVTHD